MNSRLPRTLTRTAGLAGAIALALLPGCGGMTVVGQARTSGPFLRLANHTDIQSLDPAIAYDITSWPLIRLVYEGLLDYDRGTRLVPSLATSMPRISADGRTYVFHLRHGVRFTSGREVTAEDFIYTLERILDPKTRSPGEGFFRNIAGAETFQAQQQPGPRPAAVPAPSGPGKRARVAGLSAPEPYTLVIRLERPDLSFLNIMALPFAYVVDRSVVERYGADFFRNPGGTGPFQLVEWSRGLRLRFERKRDHPPAAAGQLRRVEVMIGAEDLVQEMMFERGELDLIQEIPTPDFPRIVAEPKWQPSITSMDQNAVMYVGMNCEMAPFTDRRVRQALNMAISKERILKIVNGRGVAARGVLPPMMPGYNPQLRGYPYSPERARQLLVAAGYPNGFSTTMWVIADRSQDVRIAEAIQQDLAGLGIKLELKNVAFASWNDAVGRRKTVPMALSGWYQDYPDPADFLDVLLAGYRIEDVACNNYAFYASAEVDRCLRQAGRETDPARRLEWFQKAEERVVADAPWVFLYHPRLFMLHQTRLRGFAMHPVWNYRLETLSAADRP